jgi:hypothetical protein
MKKPHALLDQITEAAQPEAVAPMTIVAAESDRVAREETRLKAAIVFQTFNFLGQSIETAQAAYGKLLDAQPQQLDSLLGDLIAAAEGIKTKAGRLLASNK